MTGAVITASPLPPNGLSRSQRRGLLAIRWRKRSDKTIMAKVADNAITDLGGLAIGGEEFCESSGVDVRNGAGAVGGVF